MSTLPYHRRYHCDALTGYANLSLEERGAYTTILDLIYDAAGPISSNRRMLAGWLQCSTRKVDVILSALIAKGKIYITRDGRLSNRRAEQELRSTLEISRKRAENAMKQKRIAGEPPKKVSNNSVAAEQVLSGCSVIPEPEPDIIPSEQEVRDARPSRPDVPDPREQSEEVRAAPPVRRETLTGENWATKLMKSGTALPPIDAGRGSLLVDTLDRRTAPSPWPVQKKRQSHK